MPLRLAPLLSFFVLAMSACSAPDAAPKREDRPRIKGVELYSWQEEDGEWVFALLDGTNRLKARDEVRSGPHRLEGLVELEAAFALLAQEEQVFWLHHIEGFEFPGAELRAEIVAAAADVGVALWDGNEE